MYVETALVSIIFYPQYFRSFYQFHVYNSDGLQSLDNLPKSLNLAGNLIGR